MQMVLRKCQPVCTVLQRAGIKVLCVSDPNKHTPPVITTDNPEFNFIFISNICLLIVQFSGATKKFQS